MTSSSATTKTQTTTAAAAAAAAAPAATRKRSGSVVCEETPSGAKKVCSSAAAAAAAPAPAAAAPPKQSSPVAALTATALAAALASAAAKPVPGAANSRAAIKARTAFMMQLNGLFGELARLLPENEDVPRAEVAAADLTAIFPNRLIEIWGGTVVPLCGAQLLARDLDYFLNLDVPSTVARLQSEGVLPQDLGVSDLNGLIDSAVRRPVRALRPADQAKCMDTLATLTSLAKAYHATTTTTTATTTTTPAAAVVKE